MWRAVAAGLCLLAGMASAHDGVDHKTRAEARAHAAQDLPALGAPTALPFDLGGAFSLTDHTGAARSEADPDGRYQLLFFGYANCPSICAVAMPLMGQVTDALAASGIPMRPVMVTVDPSRDTVETMAQPLQALHPEFVGLTGTDAELAHVYDLYRVEKELVFEDPDYGPIYAHGSHIYLLDARGKVLTLLPPILSADRVTQIVENYAKGGV